MKANLVDDVIKISAIVCHSLYGHIIIAHNVTKNKMYLVRNFGHFTKIESEYCLSSVSI